ncbi:ScbA/BarX family gamma-butyrolactone biosynthesis protein [Streptomyces sp. NPDC090131]|uniref:ScbA/BarX family gamma-butyrolactone biosynthesis protein n=1 Tax=Streptomyces sp. NPDC090131 TaxID=3365954 RepID=UPI0037F4FB6D
MVINSFAVQEPSNGCEQPTLTFDRGVPRTLVHKTAVSEVLLTDAVRTGVDRYTVAAQWPHHHVLFDSGLSPSGTADPLLLVETVRQAGIYLSHVYYNVPRNHPFVLTSLDCEVGPSATPLSASNGPHSVLVDIVCRLDADAADRFGMSLDAVLVVDGRVVGRVGLCWQALSPERYERIRFPRTGQVAGHAEPQPQPQPQPPTQPQALAAPLLPAQVFGRFYERDAMLASGAVPESWQLRLDTAHPVYFDHACDHVPGMSLIEAFSQAATLSSARATGVDPALLRWSLESSAVSFLSFGELDVPVTVTADHVAEPSEAGRHTVRVAAEQDGRLLAVAALIGVIAAPTVGGAQ